VVITGDAASLAPALAKAGLDVSVVRAPAR
jgi:hypothetical protein